MILKASQRGGAAKLAAHLLSTQENEHVELFEISGFLSETLQEALQGLGGIFAWMHQRLNYNVLS